MKLLITGASGFVGKNLSLFLEAQNNTVQKLSLRTESWKKHFPNDADSIIHLAGKAHDLENVNDPEEYFEVNYGLTKELFKRFIKSDSKDFIYFSSVKAVADSVDGVLKEEVKPTPKTPYGQSKLQAEEYLLSQSLPKEKRIIILRPCIIHGPGNKGNLNLLYKVTKKGIPYPLGSFENQRSFLSIDNLKFIIQEILKNPDFQSGVYNVSDDESLSTNELIRIIGEVTGTKGTVWNIPKQIISSIAKVGDIIHLPLNSERLKKLSESYVVSNKKIKSALGIKMLPLSSKEGLENTIKSFK